MAHEPPPTAVPVANIPPPIAVSEVEAPNVNGVAITPNIASAVPIIAVPAPTFCPALVMSVSVSA